MKSIASCLLLSLGLGGSVLALAQPLPNAGSLLQNIERDRLPSLPPAVAPERPVAPPPMQAQPSIQVTVKQFRFAGNTLLGNAELEAALADYLNRPLSFQELQEAAATVANTYRVAGWVVRAYLPRQEIVDGVVTIQIIEAVFGGVRPEGEGASRVAFDQLQALVEAQQASGELLNADDLDRALLLADDLPGVMVSGSLQPGTGKNQSELLLRSADEPFVAGSLQADNAGSVSTGREQAFAQVQLNSPLGFGDLLGLSGLRSEGGEYARLAYSLPVGIEGWRIGANASTFDYELIASDFEGLDSNGSADSAGLEASYPLLRSRLKNLYLGFNYDQRRYQNYALGSTVSDYQSEVLSTTLSGNLFDRFGGGGANSASLVLSVGDLDLDGSPHEAAVAATTRTAGEYHKLRYALSRQQVLTENLSLYGALSGQWASQNLDSSEQFYLGGARGVRAYPADEAGGSEAQLVNLELRRSLPWGFGATAFYDWGHVKVNQDDDFPGAASLNAFELKGYGLALGWSTNFGLNLSATWARRDGENPNPTLGGDDQDGTLVRDRYWLVANLNF